MHANPWVLGLIVVLLVPKQVVSVHCNERLYGTPKPQDCVAALSNLQTGNGEKRLFVEQQLRTKQPQGNWQPIVDPRPVGAQQEIVQIPKLWSHGL